MYKESDSGVDGGEAIRNGKYFFRWMNKKGKEPRKQGAKALIEIETSSFTALRFMLRERFILELTMMFTKDHLAAVKELQVGIEDC